MSSKTTISTICAKAPRMLEGFTPAGRGRTEGTSSAGIGVPHSHAQSWQSCTIHADDCVTIVSHLWLNSRTGSSTFRQSRRWRRRPASMGSILMIWNQAGQSRTIRSSPLAPGACLLAAGARTLSATIVRQQQWPAGGVPRFSLRIFDGRSRLNVCLLGDCEFVLRDRCLRLWLAAFINCSTPVHVDSRGLGWMKCGDGQICKYTAARRCL